MKLIIEISDETYEETKKYGIIEENTDEIAEAVIVATPLPKGHGRLIDADKLEMRDISPESWYSPMWGLQISDIEDAPTIVEADKEVENDN